MAKKTTFDSKAIQRAVDKATPKTLLEAGKYVWRIARASVKHRQNPNVASAPGKAPFSHAAKTNPGFKKTIVYGMESNKRSVLVGPMLVRGGLTNIAKVHEFGGSARVLKSDPVLSNGAPPGTEAPVTVNHLTKKDTILRNDAHKDPLNGRQVVWIRLRTKQQIKHSRRLYNRINKKYGTYVRANYPARPYMRPALVLSTPKLGGFWRNAVKP